MIKGHMGAANPVSVRGREPAALGTFPALFQRQSCIVGLIILIYSISLLVVASALRQQYGFPLDDSYILQTVARNFAHYGVLGFIPGVPSSGATSVLWACMQAANHRLLHADPVIFNLALSWVLLASIGTTLFLLARRDGLSLSLSFGFAAAPAFCGNFVWLGLIGMEHLLFVAIVLATIYFWFDIGRHSLRSALLAGIGAGLLAITRPEAMALGPLIVATAWKIKRSTREALSALAVWAIFIAITVGTNLHTSHAWMPATLQGRTWLYFRASGGPHSLVSIEHFLFTWLLRPSMQFSLWIARPDLPSYQAILVTCIPILIASLGALWIFNQRPPRVIFLFFLALAHFFIYLLTFPTMGHGGRYQPLNLLLLFPCLFAGLLFLFNRARKLHPQTPIAIAAAVLVVAGAMSLRVWRTVAIDGIGQINNTHGKAAQWILQNQPATARIAAFDIGRISYALNRPIIDLGGLADPAYVPYLISGRVPLYVQSQHVNILILPDGVLGGNLGFSQSELARTKLAEFCGTPDRWRLGFRYTANVQRCQSIYRTP
jgi:hypothetical protein